MKEIEINLCENKSTLSNSHTKMTYCYGKKRECAIHQHIDGLMAIVNGLQIAELEIKDMDVNICLLMYLQI